MNQRCIVRCPYALQSGVQQRKMAFTYLSIPAKMVRGDVPYYMKIWPKLTNPPSKTPISNRYLLVAPQL